jgi:hypothetical protein
VRSGAGCGGRRGRNDGVVALGDAASGGPGRRGRQRRVAVRVGALERGAARRRLFHYI